ncbi:MAG: tetratricopeptide repeat protein [Proteobacteria bacterium]|nr:tetratricopeptide repeat protein [Pseudomonadota bacterium]
MTDQVEHTTDGGFEADVVNAERPVLVDFWADWCEPCKTVMPVLAKLVDEYAGKFILAKVDTEKEQELAAHFGIKSLPTMKLIVNGQIVAERSGALPEGEIREFIKPFITSESDKIMLAAMTAHEENRFADALELMNQALAKDPSNSDLKINIARVIFTQDDKVGSLALLDSLSDDDKNKPDAVKLRAEIKMSDQLENTPDLDQIEQRLVDNPNDCEALLHKSHHLSANGDHELAMDCLIKIILVDRQFEDDAGHKGLLAMFDMLGGESTSVQKYRRKLFTLLH